MKKLLKLLAIAGLAMGAVGCASVGGVANKVVNNNKEGTIYGIGTVSSEATVEELCIATKNKDKRCEKPRDYTAIVVTTEFGFSSAWHGIIALVDNNFKDLEKLNFKGRTGDKNAPYVKAKVNNGAFGDILEIVSNNGDGKCYWSGMPRAGGVVCPDYNYDYDRDFNGINR